MREDGLHVAKNEETIKMSNEKFHEMAPPGMTPRDVKPRDVTPAFLERCRNDEDGIT